MPFILWVPILLAGGAVALAAKGASDSVDGMNKLKRARSMVEHARNRFEESKHQLERQRRKTDRKLNSYRDVCLEFVKSSAAQKVTS